MFYDQPIHIICDNRSAISMSKNLIFHSKKKHIQINYLVLREQVVNQILKLEYIPTKKHVADIFTKPLPREKFEYLRQTFGVVPLTSLHQIFFQDEERKLLQHIGDFVIDVKGGVW